MRKSVLHALVIVFTVASCLAISGWLPPTLGFATALIALLSGPGYGSSFVLFRSGELSWAERAIFTIVLSIFGVVGTLFVLNSIAVALSRFTIVLVVFMLTVLGTIVSVLVNHPRNQPSPRRPWVIGYEALSFAAGFIAALVLGLGTYFYVR